MKAKAPDKKSSKKKSDSNNEEPAGFAITGASRLMGTAGPGTFQIPSDVQPNSEEEEQTVSIVKFNEMKEDYKGRIDKLDKKVAEQKATIADLRKEKKDAEDKAEKFRKQVEELEEKVEAKKGMSVQDAEEIFRLKKLNGDLEKALKTAEEDAQRDLKKDLGEARETIESLKADKESMAQRIKDLESNVEELKNDRAEAERKLEEALKTPQRTRIDEPETAGTVRREGPTTFSSNLFISPRYDVKLAKSGKYIAFEPNVTGISECVNNRLEAPGLDSYVGYQGVKDHTAVRKGTKLVIYL